MTVIVCLSVSLHSTDNTEWNISGGSYYLKIEFSVKYHKLGVMIYATSDFEEYLLFENKVNIKDRNEYNISKKKKKNK